MKKYLTRCASCKSDFMGRKPAKYCSLRCFGASNIGKKLSQEHRKSLSDGSKGKNTGPNQWQWKGEKVSYGCLHSWLRRQYGNPKCCEKCGVSGEKRNGRWNIWWANISGEYKRDIADFMGMCCTCHKRYDVARINVKRLQINSTTNL